MAPTPLETMVAAGGLFHGLCSHVVDWPPPWADDGRCQEGRIRFSVAGVGRETGWPAKAHT